MKKEKEKLTENGAIELFKDYLDDNSTVDIVGVQYPGCNALKVLDPELYENAFYDYCSNVLSEEYDLSDWW